MHETRKGEMAALNEIPFGRYYGSIDATPLFIIFAGSYYERTGDQAFIEQIWPHIELALQWIEMDSWSIAANPTAGSSIKGGKIHMMPCFTLMVVRPKDPSRSAKCKRIYLPPNGERLD
jgi:glycogen debranching enzyme